MKVDLGQFGIYELNREIEAAIVNGDTACIENHIGNGWNVNELLRLDGMTVVTPVVLAIIRNDYKTLEFLVKHKANLDYKNTHAFLYAARCCDKKMVRYVASLGAKIDSRYLGGIGAYELACEYSDEDKIQLFGVFEELGLDAKRYAEQALIMEVNKDIKVLEYLLKQGVNVEATDLMFPGGRMTAMMYAIMHGNQEAVKLLIKYGADVTHASILGTPYEVAREQDQSEIAEYLKAAATVKLNRKQECTEVIDTACFKFVRKKEENCNSFLLLAL